MSRLSVIGTTALSVVIVRQLFVLSAMMRSHRFLRAGPAGISPPVAQRQVRPMLFIVLPVLREAAILSQAVAHFQAIARGHAAQVIVVTTAREAAEARVRGRCRDTVALAGALADQGQCVHLHYPDPDGLKADQLNFAAAYCMTALPDGLLPADAFLICYDADSRPPQESLACFTTAITRCPGADVFHQSSRFESRPPSRSGRRPIASLRLAICDAGALRANRFVLGFEIPRLLNRSPRASAAKRIVCSGVYAHVTGHGLCVRLSLLDRLPFPSRSPLEDMHYSFVLGSRGVPMVPVPSLDCAEVPLTVAAQLGQAARWFFGPARFARYLKDPATQRGWRARVMAASAFGSAAEWIACAFTPAVIVVALVAGGTGPLRAVAGACAAACSAQVMLTEVWLGSADGFWSRAVRMMAFPLACTIHGIGGIAGAARLLTGGSSVGKTERGAPA